jgi:hypothetical protein
MTGKPDLADFIGIKRLIVKIIWNSPLSAVSGKRKAWAMGDQPLRIVNEGFPFNSSVVLAPKNVLTEGSHLSVPPSRAIRSAIPLSVL